MIEQSRTQTHLAGPLLLGLDSARLTRALRRRSVAGLRSLLLSCELGLLRLGRLLVRLGRLLVRLALLGHLGSALGLLLRRSGDLELDLSALDFWGQPDARDKHVDAGTTYRCSQSNAMISFARLPDDQDARVEGSRMCSH